ncbi:MAG TPA: hypothetical protein VLL30_18270 [Reyranella sp.]|nr:hypothetical protein [Reyranella sp.]
MRLAFGLPAAAAIAQQDDAARRADGDGRQVDAPVGDDDAGGLACRVGRFADQHRVEAAARRPLARRHRLPGAGSALQHRTGRRPLDDRARHRHGPAVAAFAQQDKGEGYRRCGLGAGADGRGRQDGGDQNTQNAPHLGLHAASPKAPRREAG